MTRPIEGLIMSVLPLCSTAAMVGTMKPGRLRIVDVLRPDWGLVVHHVFLIAGLYATAGDLRRLWLGSVTTVAGEDITRHWVSPQ